MLLRPTQSMRQSSKDCRPCKLASPLHNVPVLDKRLQPQSSSVKWFNDRSLEMPSPRPSIVDNSEHASKFNARRSRFGGRLHASKRTSSSRSPLQPPKCTVSSFRAVSPRSTADNGKSPSSDKFLRRLVASRQNAAAKVALKRLSNVLYTGWSKSTGPFNSLPASVFRMPILSLSMLASASAIDTLSPVRTMSIGNDASLFDLKSQPDGRAGSFLCKASMCFSASVKPSVITREASPETVATSSSNGFERCVCMLVTATLSSKQHQILLKGVHASSNINSTPLQMHMALKKDDCSGSAPTSWPSSCWLFAYAQTQ
mmetsp:Transcript_46306/g.128867  ORF Transcript_46306/g.128867 Transcript_46306/m.128867 type:complete len:315 (-) Transcript_46306:91-1035(-)